MYLTYNKKMEQNRHKKYICMYCKFKKHRRDFRANFKGNILDFRVCKKCEALDK